MQRLTGLVMGVDLGVYRVTQQDPAVVVVLHVVASVEQITKPDKVLKFDCPARD